MIKRDSKWILVNVDIDENDKTFPNGILKDSANILTVSKDSCCQLQDQNEGKIIFSRALLS